MKTDTVMWLLPVVFMIHDFEEIVMFKAWTKRAAPRLHSRFPGFARRVLPHLEGLSTPAFALAVAEEFVLISLVTLLAVERGDYALWMGVLAGFFIHLVVHLGQALLLRGYVPALLTSLPAGAYSLWAARQVAQTGSLDWGQAAAWSLVAILVIAANLVLAHRLAARYNAYLRD